MRHSPPDGVRLAQRRERAGPSPRPEPLFLILLVVLSIVVLDWQWIGLLASDDLFYAAGAEAWLTHFPAVGSDHWELRYPIVLPLALSFLLFGKTEFSLVLPSLVSFVTLAAIFYLFVRKRYGVQTAFVATALLVLLPITPMLATSLEEDVPEALFATLSLISFIRAVEDSRPVWSVASGVAAALGFLTRETTAALVIFYGILFLFHPMMDRRSYCVMAAGFLAVVCAEAAYFWFQTGDPLYRETISLHHDVVSRMGDFNKAQERGFLTDPQGNPTVNPIIDPLLVLLVPTKFNFVFYLAAAGLARLVRVNGLSSSARRAVILLSCAAGAWFAFIAMNAEILFLVPRYFYVVGVWCCLPAALALGSLWQRPGRLVPWLATGAVVAAAVAVMALQNTDPLFPSRVLAAYAQSLSETIYTDNRTADAANFMLAASGSAQKVVPGKPPPGALVAVQEAPLYTLPGAAPVIVTTRTDLQVVQRASRPEYKIASLFRAIGLDRDLPRDLWEKLSGQGNSLVIYRMVH